MKQTANVILAGTVHLDQEASSVLYSLLEVVSPACIAVEISPFSIRYRSRNERIWLRHFIQAAGCLPVASRRHVKLELLKRQITMPFEWSVAKEYSSRHGIDSIPVDSSRLSRKELPNWQKELLSLENMLFLVSLENQSSMVYFSNHYKRALHILRNPKNFLESGGQLVFDENWCKREEVLVRRVANLAGRFSPLVYIGGWMHLIKLSEPLTLASMLKIDWMERYLVTRRKAVKI